MKAEATYWITSYAIAVAITITVIFIITACWKISGDPFGYGRMPDLQNWCIAYVDTEGLLRGRNAKFTEEMFEQYKGNLFIYSHVGQCTNEGAPRRVLCPLPEGMKHMWEDECLKKHWQQEKL